MQKLLSQIIRFAYYMLRARAQEIKIKNIYQQEVVVTAK